MIHSITDDGAKALRNAILRQFAKDLMRIPSKEIWLEPDARSLRRRELDWLFEDLPLDGPEFLRRITARRRALEALRVRRMRPGREWTVLKQLREARGWTQDYVVKRLGIRQPTYANIERGSRKPSLEMLAAIMELYRVDDPEELFKMAKANK